MPVIPFGEWLPDMAAYKNPGLLTASNVFPSGSGYLPVLSLGAVTNALDARPRGAIQARDKNGNPFQYAGDATKLYENVNGVWTDRSKVGGYATADEEAWEFVPWKNKILAVNFSNNPQQAEFGDSFSDLTADFRARHITSIRDFVVVANTLDSADDLVPSRVRWSAFNNEEDWTVSPSTLSDFQDLQTASVERIFGGEFGVILQTNSVYRMSFVGGEVVFQFDEVLPGVGLISPGAAVRDGDIVYLWSDRGFFALVNGTQATPIGANKIDRFALNDLDQNFLNRMSAVADPATHRILFAYPGAGNTNGLPNKILVYDRPLDRWTLVEEEVELLWRAGGTSVSIDDMSGSIDDIEGSLDSSIFIGGSSSLAAFNPQFKSGFFSGAAMEGSLETGDIEIHGGHRTQLNAFRALVEDGTVTARVGARNRQSDEVLFGPELSQRPSGRFTYRKNARYHRFRYKLTDGWEHAIGMQIEPQEAIRSERRG